MKRKLIVLVLLALTPPIAHAADDLTNTYYRIRADFNADGISDAAVSTTRNNFGNAGGTFTVYLGTTNGVFLSLGSVFMHPLAANLASKRAGEGILTVFVRGGHEGSLITYSVTSARISETGRRSLIARDGGPEADWKVYKSYFRDGVRLTADLMKGSPEPAGGAYFDPAAGSKSAHP